MKLYIYKLSLILVALVFITGCQKEYPLMFDTSTKVVGFSTPTLTIKENAPSGAAKLYLGGVLDAPATDVTIEVSVEGISKPAIEGTDFTISSKTITLGVGETDVTISPIDNDVFQGNKQFKLLIKSNSKSYPLSTNNSFLVTITDDEHPLKTWIGTYKVAAVSYWSPGEYDEEWTVTTSPDPTDITKLVITGIGTSDPSTTGWIGVVNKTEMTITFSPGQQLDHAYLGSNGTLGPVLMYLGTPDITTIKESDIVGTISDNGDIHIDNVGIELTGTNEGYVWDSFNTTWTKQ